MRTPVKFRKPAKPLIIFGFTVVYICSALPSFALNACVDSAGKKIFSDLPCRNNNAEQATVSREIQERRARAQARNDKISPPELMQAYDRCSFSAGLGSIDKFRGCLTSDPFHAQIRSESDVLRLMKKWRNLMPNRPEVLSGSIDKNQRSGELVVAIYEDLDIDREQKLFIKHKPRITFNLDKDQVWRVLAIN